MKVIKTLGYLGLLATVIVGLGEHFLHYSPSIFEHSENYEFFRYVPIGLTIYSVEKITNNKQYRSNKYFV